MREGRRAIAVITMAKESCKRTILVIRVGPQSQSATSTIGVLTGDQQMTRNQAGTGDLDGDLDLLVAGQISKNVVWFENPRK